MLPGDTSLERPCQPKVVMAARGRKNDLPPKLPKSCSSCAHEKLSSANPASSAAAEKLPRSYRKVAPAPANPGSSAISETLAKSCRKVAQGAGIWSNFEQFWTNGPTVGQIWPTFGEQLAGIGQNWPTLARILADAGRIWAKLGKHRLKVAHRRCLMARVPMAE